MASPSEPQLTVNMYPFDTLVQLTIRNAIRMIEYFRLNLVYYRLVSGKGLEFDKLKMYSIGDNPRQMAWKVFAKTKELYIKSYKEEREFDIIIVVDVSDSMLLGTAQLTKSEFAAQCAGILGYAAIDAQDRVAITMISDKVLVATDPSNDFYGMLHMVTDKANWGGRKDWNNLAKTLIGNYQKENTIVFIISDFIDSNPETFMPDLATNFAKVYGIMVRDPVDDHLPKNVGKMYLKGLQGKDFYLADLDSAREEYEELARIQKKRIKESFQNYEQLFFSMETNQEFTSEFIKKLGMEKVELS